MKKVLIISFLIFTILISFFSTSFAVVTITEDSFQQSLTKILDPNNTLIKMDTENDTITIVAKNYIFGYNFDNNPTFTLEFNFNKEMSGYQCEYHHQCISFLLGMFQVISDHFGIDENVALNYYSDKIDSKEDVKKLTCSWLSSMDDFDNAVQYAKSIFDNNINFSDSLFTIESQKLEETAENYKAQVIFTVNLDGDFSKMNNSNDNKKDPIISEAQNAVNEYKNTAEKKNQLLQNYIDYLNSKSNSISKLPQTGDFFNEQDALFFLIFISAVGIVFLLIPNIKYRNIDIK